MKFFPKAVLATLVVTTFTSTAYSDQVVPVSIRQKILEIPDISALSYDEIVDFLALIESPSFGNNCSVEELNKANQLLAFLALEGATESEKPAMQLAVNSLFEADDYPYAYSLDANASYLLSTALFSENTQDILLCRSRAKKQWDSTRFTSKLLKGTDSNHLKPNKNTSAILN